jgi:uncharacterized protein (UPF0333 family)
MITRKVKAQSIVEYLLVFGAIVLAVIFGAQQLGNSTKTQMAASSKTINKVDTTLSKVMGSYAGGAAEAGALSSAQSVDANNAAGGR